MAGRPVGEWNGKWGAAIKLAVMQANIVGPLLLAWFVWATPNIIKNSEFREKGDRFTREDGANLKSWHNEDMDAHIKDLRSEMLAQIERMSQ